MKAITKVFSVMVALTMVLGGFMALAAMSSAEPDAWVNDDYQAMTLGPEFRKAGIDYFALADAARNAPGASADLDNHYDVGESEDYAALNLSSGKYEFTEFTKRGECEHCEVWVADDLSWPEGDPRNEDVEKITITNDMVEYIMGEFNDTIWAVETTNYTTPDFHDGNNSYAETQGWPFMQTENGTNTMIMIWNMKDDNYYNSSYGSYVAGFYSPTIEFIYDRNVIHIDAWNWTERTRAVNPTAEPLYEGVVAHEWQHLLQDDTDPNEATWLNEALSMYTEDLCGYALEDYFADLQFFLDCPTNSLVEWGDQGDLNILADYSAVTLFMQYLDDHFVNATGSASGFIGEIQRDANHSSMDSVEYILAENGYDMTFEELYENFMIANLYETIGVDDGDTYHTYNSWDFSDVSIPERIYGPDETLNLNISVFDMAWDGGEIVDAGDFFGDAWIYYQDASTGISGISGWGSRVVELDNWYDMPYNLVFDGQDGIEKMWTMIEDPIGSNDMVWYSGAQDEFESLLWTTLDLSADESYTLSFDTYYDIEDYWDFGFVQASLDGETWASLSNNDTTSDYDPGAMESIIDQLPGLTGYVDDWTNMEFDLSEYAGNDTVYLRFNYATDWGTTYYGWLIDNIALNGDVIANEDFETTITPVSFTVTLICTRDIWSDSYIPSINYMELPLDENNAFSLSLVSLMDLHDAPISLWSEPSMYLLVTPDEGASDFSIGCGDFFHRVM